MKMKTSVLFFLFSILGLIQFPEISAEAIAVIVNKSNPLTELSLSDVNKIYKGRKRKWESGQTIVAINRPTASNLRKHFYRLVLKTKATKKFFLQGSPIPFKTLRMKSDLAAKKFVARLPNAIGYISVSEVDNSVKVLMIDGTLPSSPKYALTHS